MTRTIRTVIVRNLAIWLSIGVHEHEKKAEQRLLVSVEAELADATDEADRIDATLDYDRVCDFIRSLSRRPHVELQETVARLVLDFVMAEPKVRGATVETCKPDIFADCEYVGVRIQSCKVDAA